MVYYFFVYGYIVAGSSFGCGNICYQKCNTTTSNNVLKNRLNVDGLRRDFKIKAEYITLNPRYYKINQKLTNNLQGEIKYHTELLEEQIANRNSCFLNCIDILFNLKNESIFQKKELSLEKNTLPKKHIVWVKLLLYIFALAVFLAVIYFSFNDVVRCYLIILTFIAVLTVSFLFNQKLKKEIEVKRNAERALKHSENLFRGVFNNAAAGIVLLNRDGNYQHANLTFCRMIGYSEEELQTMKFQDITYPEDLEECILLYEGIWQESYSWINCEKRYICKNGTVLWAEINMSAIRGEDKEITDIIVVIIDISVRKRMEEELKHQAATDALTGVDNRRAFLNKAQEEFARAQRYKRDFALLLLDVDKFKFVNDRYGHLVGDRVLRDVVLACKSALRETDILARIGGEEFAVILLESEIDTAYHVALRIQEKVKEVIVQAEENQIQVTVSIGIAMRNDGDTNLESIYKRADDALYEAKNSGRNRIRIENGL